MKKLTILSILIASAMSFFTACNSKQAADQVLNDESQRKAVITSIAHHETYSMEMMKEMMNSDSCKVMMGQHMMGDTGMMNMMMGNMMNMAEKDSAMCKNMMQMMHQKPAMMKMMNNMKNMSMPMGSTTYTCPMHSEIKSATPGKCPKCGMDLVKMKENKNMDNSKTKMQ